jgi:hypothetical protein
VGIGIGLQHQELNSLGRNSIASAAFSDDFKQWHIAKHDVYGNDFIQAWESSGEVEICPEDMEAIPQDF